MTLRCPLTVEADVTIDAGRHQLTLRSHGHGLVLQVPSSAAGLGLRQATRYLRTLRYYTRQLAPLIQHTGLTITIQTPDRRLLTIGPEAGSWLLRLLGVKHATVHLH